MLSCFGEAKEVIKEYLGGWEMLERKCSTQTQGSQLTDNKGGKDSCISK